jgi:hypothetical protein
LLDIAGKQGFFAFTLWRRRPALLNAWFTNREKRERFHVLPWVALKGRFARGPRAVVTVNGLLTETPNVASTAVG